MASHRWRSSKVMPGLNSLPAIALLTFVLVVAMLALLNPQVGYAD